MEKHSIDVAQYEALLNLIGSMILMLNRLPNDLPDADIAASAISNLIGSMAERLTETIAVQS